MGIPLLAGSDFAPLDDTVAPPQAIVNDAFVRRYLDGGEAIGRTIEARGVVPRHRRRRADVGVRRVRRAADAARALLLSRSAAPVRRDPREDEARRRNRDGGDDPPRRRAISMRRLPVYNVRTLPEHIARNLVLRRVPARMFLVLGPLLLVLAAIGIYAVVDYTVAQRTSEIGAASGARRAARGRSSGRSCVKRSQWWRLPPAARRLWR